MLIPDRTDSAETFLRTESGEPARLLLVGRDADARQKWKERLGSTHWEVHEAGSGAEALEHLMTRPTELMLLDPDLPDLRAAEFETMVRQEHPGLQVVLLAPPNEPFQPPTIAVQSPDEARAYRSVTLHAEALPGTSPIRASRISEPTASWHDLVGSSPAMQKVYRAGKLVAPRDTTVLIQGESGTGKDLLAQAIHQSSARSRQPFIVINCAAIPEALLESELFGYTKGAFTGAAQSRLGRIHAAHGGTLFLDEIGDMPFPLQSKILRFLEQGEVQRIGGSDTLKVDCRILTATNVDLKAQVKAGRFREDLYYRLAIFPILLPPLREHLADLPELVSRLTARVCPGTCISAAAMQVLQRHHWPGNVRELRNVLERASLFADGHGVIDTEDISF